VVTPPYDQTNEDDREPSLVQ